MDGTIKGYKGEKILITREQSQIDSIQSYPSWCRRNNSEDERREREIK